MKEFEKWHKKFKIRSCIAKIHRKAGWHGAFERILEECHHQNQDVIDFILKELEEVTPLEI